MAAQLLERSTTIEQLQFALVLVPPQFVPAMALFVDVQTGALVGV